MPKRTDVSFNSALGAGTPLPAGEGLGVGERAAGSRLPRGVGCPHPTLPRTGEGLRVAISGEGEFVQDRGQDAVGVLQDNVVPVPEHAVAVRFDDLGPRIVGGVIRVLPAIEFDCKPRGAAGEVHDEVADRTLAGELLAKLAPAQPRPQPLFRFGRIGAKLARDWREAFCHHRLYTPTQPSPARGRALIAKFN